MNTEKMNQIYNEVTDFAEKKIAEGCSPHEVAAVLATIGATIYRANLNAAEYDLTIDAVKRAIEREYRVSQGQDRATAQKGLTN